MGLGLLHRNMVRLFTEIATPSHFSKSIPSSSKGKGGGTDTNLDTNSEILKKLTYEFEDTNLGTSEKIAYEFVLMNWILADFSVFGFKIRIFSRLPPAGRSRYTYKRFGGAQSKNNVISAPHSHKKRKAVFFFQSVLVKLGSRRWIGCPFMILLCVWAPSRKTLNVCCRVLWAHLVHKTVGKMKNGMSRATSAFETNRLHDHRICCALASLTWSFVYSSV